MFLKKYSPLYSTLYENQNIDEIPWEIKPIWTEKYRYPKEVKNKKSSFSYGRRTFFMPAVSFSVGNRSYKKTERCHEIIFCTVLFFFVRE